jgi:sterol desaturase/sphingolipid hydroxylase (fatty acid hydroxylase superfamily)
MSEAALRLVIFLGLLAVFAGLEAVAPRRPRRFGRGRRWLTNLGMSVLDSLALRALAIGLPALAVGAAADAGAQGWGLLNHLSWPPAVEFVLAVLAFDFAIWAQHLISHKVGLFWRFHRVHHADPDFDVTTAVRFHPVEIAASMAVKIALVYLIGPSALAMLSFEIMLNGTALFNHSNLRLPAGLDRVLRLVLVTPDMHRVHHSVRREEHDSNYGFALSLWDRLLRTYRAVPQGGQDGMVIGLAWQDAEPTKLGWSLALPFRKKP